MTTDTTARPADEYGYVEDAIRFLVANAHRQPSLAQVAASVGVSESHFQRVFSRWAGISPKRFVQFLTVEHAKDLLRGSRSLLDATFESGLSSPSRLHDLFVTVEAVTPGEYKREGDGLTISHGRHSTPFGDCIIATTPRGICGLYFVQATGVGPIMSYLHRSWPGAHFFEDQRSTAPIVHRIFSALFAGDQEPLPLLLKGSNFQIAVWKALLTIPEGAVVSYEELAAAVGNPSGARAVGNAVGSNPISFLVPCHRVIRKTGHFGNYGGGVERKMAMLAWEAAKRPETSDQRAERGPET